MCELRDSDDTRVLSANVRISGASQVCALSGIRKTGFNLIHCIFGFILKQLLYQYSNEFFNIVYLFNYLELSCNQGDYEYCTVR